MRCQLSTAMFVAFVVGAFAVPVAAQSVPPVAKAVSLDGPRIGITFLSDGVIESLKERNKNVGPTISQFGWQFERQFYNGSGVTAVTEAIMLVGGLDQGIALPSLSWMFGIRTREGAEFGVGPNITPAGTALVFAAGHTFRSGVINVPVNIAVVPSKNGLRVTLLSGFNLRGRP
jgi:hypothetical protein